MWGFSFGKRPPVKLDPWAERRKRWAAVHVAADKREGFAPSDKVGTYTVLTPPNGSWRRCDNRGACQDLYR